MKPEWITDRVIDLAKRLNELGWRKEIREGDWYLFSSTKKTMRDVLCLWSGNGEFPKVDKYTTITPIPDLSTCLRWLMRTGYVQIVSISHDKERARWDCYAGKEEYNEIAMTSMNCPEEVAMLAMIKILGGE